VSGSGCDDGSEVITGVVCVGNGIWAGGGSGLESSEEDSLVWTWTTTGTEREVVVGCDGFAERDGQMEKELKKRFLVKHDPAQTLPIRASRAGGGPPPRRMEGHGTAAAERGASRRETVWNPADWWPRFVGGDDWGGKGGAKNGIEIGREDNGERETQRQLNTSYSWREDRGGCGSVCVCLGPT
jgi:hypothetical protein